MQIAVVTTFPNKHWQIYGQKFVQTFDKYWPKEIPLYIQLDPVDESNHIRSQIAELCAGDRPILVSNEWYQDQIDFNVRNKGKDDPKDYRFQATRFSHKVFTTAVVAGAGQFDYLIWLDADIETIKPISIEDIKKWLPKDELCSYLGRKDWTASETGFIGFNMKKSKLFIEAWKNKYVTDEIFKLKEQTDAYAFDLLRLEFTETDTFLNLTEGQPGRDIFEVSPLKDFMVHHKGPVKKEKLAQSQQMNGGSFDVSNLKIITKNCVDHEKIKANVSQNLRIVPHDRWFEPVREHNEEIVICSAGPSLSAGDIMPHYKKGTKIVAVKHAVNTLKKSGIKPWAVILLDPRPHVQDFVEYPDPETIYFVSSMVDPNVMMHLKSCGANFIAYHAMVGANEEERIPNGHFMVQGGSGTATRGISLLEGLGFRTMHLYGYDLCYPKKPNLNDKKENGRLRYEEVSLKANSWGNEQVERTFWTEGQFLAQLQEFEKLYLPKKEITYHTYGDGIIPWMHRHYQLNERWHEWLKEKDANKCRKTLTEFLN
jgi:hypothetical protein